MKFSAPIGIVNHGDFVNATRIRLDIDADATGTFLTISEQPLVDNATVPEFSIALAIQSKLANLMMTTSQLFVIIHHIEDMVDRAGYSLERLADHPDYLLSYKLTKRRDS